jgi:hypothetical protein
VSEPKVTHYRWDDLPKEPLKEDLTAADLRRADDDRPATGASIDVAGGMGKYV